MQERNDSAPKDCTDFVRAFPDVFTSDPTSGFIKKSSSLHLQRINSEILPCGRTVLITLVQMPLRHFRAFTPLWGGRFHLDRFRYRTKLESTARKIGDFTDRPKDQTV